MLTWLTCNTLWIIYGEPVYYYGVAGMIASASLVINSQTEGKRKLVSEIFVFFAFNNLADEILYDPTKIELNEYITAIIFILYITWKYLKRSKN